MNLIIENFASKHRFRSLLNLCFLHSPTKQVRFRLNPILFKRERELDEKVESFSVFFFLNLVF